LRQLQEIVRRLLIQDLVEHLRAPLIHLPVRDHSPRGHRWPISLLPDPKAAQRYAFASFELVIRMYRRDGAVRYVAVNDAEGIDVA
jgi:hypothetical protein